jgi:thioredoxin reductase (NADPH)
MFPTLTAAQLSRIAGHGRRRRTTQGEVLFDAGDPHPSFFVVLAGRVDVYRPSPTGADLVASHGPGQFSGEVNLLAGRRALVRALVAEAGEVVEIDRDHLLTIVQTDAEISEVLIRAFILRRVELMSHGLGDVVVIGSIHCAGTLRVKEFLTRNAHPYTYLDLDRDPDVQALLDRFQITPHDVPVLICRGELVLRNPSNAAIAECLGFNESLDASQIHDLLLAQPEIAAWPELNEMFAAQVETVRTDWQLPAMAHRCLQRGLPLEAAGRPPQARNIKSAVAVEAVPLSVASSVSSAAETAALALLEVNR